MPRGASKRYVDKKEIFMAMHLNFGIIGAGLMGTRRAASIATMVDTTILSVMDLTLERASALANKYGATATTDIDKLLTDKRIDCVVVTTTTPHLARYTIAALEAGKHVLVEKPLAMSMTDTRAVVEATRRCGMVVKVGFNHRYLPTVLKAREVVASGAIGKIMFLKATYGQKGRIGFENEWRARKAMGGGELLDQGVHVLDLCRQFLGDFDKKSIKGDALRLFWQGDVDDNAFVVLRSVEGVPAFIHVSSSLWRNTFSFEIQGTLGRVEIHGIRGHYGAPRLTLLTRNEAKSAKVGVYQFDEQVFEFPDEDITWEREMQSFVASVRDGAPVDGTPEDAAKVLEVIFAVYEQGEDV